MNTKIYLASASPRRRDLLNQIGLDFEVMVSAADEDISEKDPAKMVEELSLRKAKAVEAKLIESGKEGGAIIIGADTVVAARDPETGKEIILGKPKDAADAKRMLKGLQGNDHFVYTGVALLKDGEVKNFSEKTTVRFCPMTEREIDEYIATGDPLDKAGSYGIQGFCARYIKGIDGDYNNVVGLPVSRLYMEIRAWL
ncbi:MAG: septum formation protein Maf [Lachnospiraceae bacterium]|nr:septum formation protein Maf [Lachnospiraceae bacterium]